MRTKRPSSAKASAIDNSIEENHEKQDGTTSKPSSSPPSDISLTTKPHLGKKRPPVYRTDNLIREKSPTPQSENYNDSFRKITVTTTTTTSVGIINGKRQVQCNICKRHMAESKLANHIRLMHSESNEINGDKNNNNGDSEINNLKTSGLQEKTTDQDVNKSSTDGISAIQTNSTVILNQNTISRPYRCDHCGKCYAIKYTWQQHVKTHIEGRPKCPECGGTFATAFGLFRHRVRNHNVEHNFKIFTCSECSKEFFSSSELALHQQRHSTKKEFVCPECQKAFSVKGNLRIHMRTHAKEKLYKCDICAGAFSHPYSLVSHRRIHTNDLPYKCDVCQKNYRSKHQLTSHKLVHTTDRPFKCNECSKTFRSRTAFKMHQDEHKGIKRFSCRYCDRQFQCQGNKLKHERRHEGIKSHKCDICSKAFIEKQELKNHLKIHDKPKDQRKKSQSSPNSKDKGLSKSVESAPNGDNGHQEKRDGDTQTDTHTVIKRFRKDKEVELDCDEK